MIIDDTTKMQIRDIVKNGYYRKSQTLGVGGWEFMYSQGIATWPSYLLYDGDGNFLEEIKAKDDEQAVKAFRDLYHLDMLDGWEIVEKIVTHRTVAAHEV